MTKKKISAIYQLSPIQEGIFFHSIVSENSKAYVQQYSCDFADLDVEIFKKSWEVLVDKHSILRSSFHKDLSIPLQCVHASVQMPIAIIDISHHDTNQQQTIIKQHCKDDFSKPFDFEIPPLMRITLLKLSEKQYKAVWTFEHILLDGWSMSILMGELIQLYDNLIDTSAQLEIPNDNFQDHIQYIQSRDQSEDQLYWKKYFEGFEEQTLLGKYNKTTDQNGSQPESVSISYDYNETQRIKKIAKENKVTVNTLLMGAWASLLSNYTNSKDVVFGTVTSGRNPIIDQQGNRIGPFINVLPTRVKMDDDYLVKDWLYELQKSFIKSFEHQYNQINSIASWNNIKGEFFDTLFVFENYPGFENEQDQHTLIPENVEFFELTNYPVTLLVSLNDRLTISFRYSTDLIEKAKVEMMPMQLKYALNYLITHANKSAGSVPIIPEDLLFETYESVNNNSDYPDLNSIVTEFEKSVEKNPDAVAINYLDKNITYRYLDTLTNQFAHYLIYQGVKKNDIVGVCTDRSLELMVFILGILKAGAAYLPITSQTPKGRIKMICEDASLNHVIVEEQYQAIFNEFEIHNVLNYNHFVNENSQYSISKPEINLTNNDLAYIIYTSGSTDTPKGVMVEHGNVVSLVVNSGIATLNQQTKLLQTGALSFDAITFEYWGPLLNGGCLVLCDEKHLMDASILKKHINNSNINLMWFTVGWFNQLVDYDINLFASLNTIIVGGDKLSKYHIDKVINNFSAVNFYNGYGPTENTTFSHIYKCTGQESESVPIGRPLNNRKAYILDEEGKLQSVGVDGEIYLGGAGLARGYLNNVELTHQKFVIKKNSGSNVRLLKSGDIGLIDENNLYRIKGRYDHQIKLRGYRIGLEEIKETINHLSEVKQAIVKTFVDNNDQKKLVAYVSVDGKFNKTEIAKQIGHILPEYMIPSVIIEIKEFPLTKNGKINIKALPDPLLHLSNSSNKKLDEPLNRLEYDLIIICKKALGLNHEISRNDDFFEVGGHSIIAIRVVSAIRKELGIEMPLKALFTYRTVAELASYLRQLENKTTIPLIKYEKKLNIPLSFAQERVWFIDQTQGSIQYHVPVVLQLSGQVNYSLIQEAFKELFLRHDILRTTYHENEGIPYQNISEKVNFDFDFVEVVEEEVQIEIEERLQKPFDLENDSPFRPSLIKINQDKYILVIVFHHIACDGWSLSILVNEFASIYNALSQKSSYHLTDQKVHYADYAIWQRKTIDESVLDNQLSYWKNKLTSVKPLSLPTDYKRPPVQSFKGKSSKYRLNKDLFIKAKKLSNEENVTLFMFMLSVFKLLLYKYSNQKDIVVGTVIANRNRQEMEDIIGFFTNSLPLHTSIDKEQSFLDYLSHIKDEVLEAYSHQDVPFEEIVRLVTQTRDASRNPIFQVMFIFQNTPDIPEISLDGIEISPYTFKNSTSQFDLTFDISEINGQLALNVHYCSDLFEQSTIDRMANRYIKLLNDILNHPLKKIFDIDIATQEEQRQILESTNLIERGISEETIVSSFEYQVNLNPDSIAVIYNDVNLTYNEINCRSNQLANYIMSLNLKSEAIIAVCLNRSPEMLVALLGILKSGAAYVPIAPDYPKERVNYIIEDTKTELLITCSKNFKSFKNFKGLCFCIDNEWRKISSIQNNCNLNLVIKPNNLAYVIYTSGSTGSPKGVLVEHGNVIHMLNATSRSYDFSSQDVYTFFHSFCFDVSVWEIFGALGRGCRLVIVPESVTHEIKGFGKLVNEHCITILNQTPSAFYMFKESLMDFKSHSLKSIILAGESLDPDSLVDFMKKYPTCKIFNYYGITETTVFTTCKEVSLNDVISRKNNIGGPFLGLGCHIVDENYKSLPIGIEGEIMIEGGTVARGYLNKPLMTRQKFMKCQFFEGNSNVMYTTGDRGKRLPDGGIEFLGRSDNQVKINGYRIELEEIEKCLSLIKGVDRAVVITNTDKNIGRYIIAYLKCDYPLQEVFVKEKLATYLPNYMMPRFILFVDQFKRNNNGKVDLSTLPKPIHVKAQVEEVGANTEIGRKLIKIWEVSLGISGIGPLNNFFALGGHSLLAMRIIAQINKTFNCQLTFKDLLEQPNINLLAKKIESESTGISLIQPIEEQEYYNLSEEQRRLWLQFMMNTDSIAYNVPLYVDLYENEINKGHIEETFLRLVEKYEVLRTQFILVSGQPKQKIVAINEIAVKQYDFSDRPEAYEEFCKNERQIPFELNNPPLFRVNVIKLKNHFRIFITMHHIICDMDSLQVLISELTSIYNGVKSNISYRKDNASIQFKDYTVWKHKELQKQSAQLKNYWENKFQDFTFKRAIQPDFKGESNLEIGTRINVKLDANELGFIKKMNQEHQSTLFITGLTLIKVLLYKYNNENNITIGASVSNRESVQLENQIGFFVGLVPVHSQLIPDKTFEETLANVKYNLMEAVEHKLYPIEDIVNYVKSNNEGEKSLFDCVVAASQKSSRDEIVFPEEERMVNAKFDLNIRFVMGKNAWINITYNTGVFEKVTIDILKENLMDLLNQIIQQPHIKIGDLKLFSKSLQEKKSKFKGEFKF